MNLAQLVLRKLPTARSNFLCPNTASKTIFCEKTTKEKSSSSSSSSGSSSSSESDEATEKKTTSDEAISKLNMLLKQMISEDASQSGKTLNLAQPTNKRVKGKEEKETVKVESVEKQMVNAVKNVAESLGGDAKQTESELLMKLLNPVENGAAAATTLSDIIKDMKIERETKPPPSKADQVRRILEQVSTKPKTPGRSTAPRRPRRSPMQLQQEIQPQKIDLFGSKPLGIFTDKSNLKETPPLKTWQQLHEKDLKLAITHPPANYFQEMILWTEQGKFWQFPINNEFGLEEEAKVDFIDHVFLEKHLESWCPTKGPIRHFMELVCVGLSKNSYLTVEAKKEHIEWYKNYFEDKTKLLQDIGAIEAGSMKTKSIDSQ